MNERIIFHIDVNSAFLSFEAANRIHQHTNDINILDIPSAIGGDQNNRHGIILAKSVPAKRYDITTGEPIANALKKCPNLLIIPPDFAIYKKCSSTLMTLLREYSSTLEQYSIDEAFLDMTESLYLYGTPIEAANIIRKRVYEELNFTVNIGISSNKILAKMASDFKKPNLVHTLFPNEIKTKMWPLPIRDLFFVGKATESKLNSLGILTIGDLAKMDKSIIKSHLKKHGELIHDYANGIDTSIVETKERVNKGYSNEITLPQDATNRETAFRFLLSLSETISSRLRANNVLASLISVEIKDCNFIRSTHQQTLVSPTNVTTEIYQISCNLFDESWDKATPIRLLGIRAAMVTNEAHRQYDLFSMEKFDKLAKLDKALDTIKGKYGDNSVIRASFLDKK